MRAPTLLAIVLLLAVDLRAQVSPFTPPERPEARTFYVTNGTEWLFSFPLLHASDDSVQGGRNGVVRFAPFFNPRALVHWDASDHVGFFSGLGIRNLGFILDDPGRNERRKYRAYTLSIPAGIKLGRMHNVLAFFGYDLDLPFHYQEKRFVDRKRVDRTGEWFSVRTPRLFHSVMVGVQAPYGINVTVKYTFTPFHDTGFREVVDGVERLPYTGLRTNLLQLTLNWGMHAGRERNRGTVIPAPVDPRT
ncbi:MAG: hypothetical protein IT228_05785 [Flavobacteriales bacterium]|nr:hypothetical protein [Flavobacteriales bacterium]MCC6576835.1 hypothetical protein [Flavobacteriales bacterium]NUQ14037.1 hypothetical protein [Flavobacteriales bacterium]